MPLSPPPQPDGEEALQTNQMTLRLKTEKKTHKRQTLCWLREVKTTKTPVWAVRTKRSGSALHSSTLGERGKILKFLTPFGFQAYRLPQPNANVIRRHSILPIASLPDRDYATHSLKGKVEATLKEQSFANRKGVNGGFAGTVQVSELKDFT